MSEFRICPYGQAEWKVQERRLFGWRDIGSLHYDLMFPMTRVFDSEEDAAKWIDSEIQIRYERLRANREEVERRRRVPPREYP